MTNNIIIYKIFCKNEEIKDCYIGSTSNFERRKDTHKSCCNNENSRAHNNYKYIFIRENGGWENWDYSIICKCTKEDRYKMERWYIENEKFSNLNKQIPSRTNKEYYQKNKDKQKEYREQNKEKIAKREKEYREQNKEKYKEIYKEYREQNKDKIAKRDKEYREQNKDKINEKNKERYKKNKDKIKGYKKEWYKKNKDKIKEYNKDYKEKYREKYKDKINEKNKIKITCECGSIFRKSDKARHEKSKKHLDYSTLNFNKK